MLVDVFRAILYNSGSVLTGIIHCDASTSFHASRHFHLFEKQGIIFAELLDKMSHVCVWSGIAIQYNTKA